MLFEIVADNGGVMDLRSLVEDEPRFRAWFDASMPRVYSYLFSRSGGDAVAAEELTQQTFEAAIRRPEGYRGESEVMTWLIAIARQKLVDHARRVDRERQRIRELDVGEPADGPGWDDMAIRDRTARAMEALTAEQLVALVLHVVDGFSVADVAAEIGRTEDATQALIGRARASFRRTYTGGADA